MLYMSAGSAATVRSTAAQRLSHRHLLMPLATFGVLAAAVLPPLGSGVASAGAPPARHSVLTAFSPGAHLASLLSLPAAARASISAALTHDLAELTPSDGVGSLRNPVGGGDQFGLSVATSGHTVVVGAPYHRAHSQADSGAVYVFQMPAAGWASATQTAELTASTLDRQS